MKHLALLERICLAGHVIAMVFGLAGLLIVLPNPKIIAALPPIGQSAFSASMVGGGAVYMVLAAIAVSIYAYRTLGLGRWLGFMVPAVSLSLCSELVGTSTGFPFGHYRYLSGLGYKIADLVPFTIPLSWFYLGLVSYVLALVAVNTRLRVSGWLRWIVAIALGSVLLTAWDFVLDPAMSQAPFPFWEFQDVGEFFGMPYRNITGWLGTGAVFMTVATLFWKNSAPVVLTRSQLTVPLIVYLVNFGFGATITLVALDQRFVLPTLISIALGVVPAVLFWLTAKPEQDAIAELEADLASGTSLETSGQTAEVVAK